MIALHRLLLLCLALLLVAAGEPDIVHAQGSGMEATHPHEADTAPSHAHLVDRCATACQVAPAVVPVTVLPRARSLAIRVTPGLMAVPVSVRAPPEPRPPRRTPGSSHPTI